MVSPFQNRPERQFTNHFDREYVAINYWPNKDAGGRQLQTMYQKIVAANNATANKDGSTPTPYSARD